MLPLKWTVKKTKAVTLKGELPKRSRGSFLIRSGPHNQFSCFLCELFRVYVRFRFLPFSIEDQ